MRAHHRSCVFGLLALGIGSWAAGLPAQAAETILVEEDHAAGRLSVSGLVGTLVIEGQDRSDISLELRGSSEALERLQRTVEGDRLELTAAPGSDGRTTVVSGRNNVVIAGPGGRATQIIGGVTTTVGGPSEPQLEVRAYVPQGAPLVVEGMVGELAVEGLNGPVELAMISGTARLERIDGGRLAVVGGSRIAVGAATGDLVIEVRGAGDVTLDQAALGRLEVGITGSGSVDVGGSAQQARVALTGSGNLRVDEVHERPETRVTGSGEVEIGNW
jgi:hypothetical protein